MIETASPPSAQPHSPAPAPMGGGPVHVPSLSESEFEALLTDLRIWVAGLVRRFALDVRTIPPCWERHNAMVETLTALRDAERGCSSLALHPRLGSTGSEPFGMLPISCATKLP